MDCEDLHQLLHLGDGGGDQDLVQIQGEGGGPPKLEGWRLCGVLLAKVISHELGGGTETILLQQQWIQFVSSRRV